MRIYKKIMTIPKEFNQCEVVPKGCYGNTFNFAVKNRDNFKKHDIKIAYGFMNKPSLADNLWFRHCFLVVNDESIIDVTIKDNEDSRYIIFKTFDSVDELLKIDEYHKDTSLARTLVKEEIDTIYPFLDSGMKERFKNYKYAQDIVLLTI